MKVGGQYRKRIKRVHERGHLHELTFSCYRGLRLLSNDAWRIRLARCLDAAGHEEAIALTAFVFMPNHVHLLVMPLTDPTNIGRYLARVKQPFSKQIRELLTAGHSSLLSRLMVRERPGKTCFRFWQRGSGYDRNLASPTAIAKSMDYIHANPVSRELCSRAVDWRWSSAGFYHGDPPMSQDPDLPKLQGLPPEYLEGGEL
ncbi:MAG: hypothetical protein DWQ31_03770 [Planctomycetota bacterium]|nr:MAG: hypothetical protein DWQ31_03770 [Planctomycetota bacterium]REJ94091.1 MAG: hypothetical protein DWQ35_08690 [Planctomycetota bacterium]REK26277.1 MAG: hypothetical protein DWQ42_09280 [Planctomycetota bacterium]REK45828.1 MAG: hypothetical protein DWQ46_07995 [Planctomycetota bacterium]